MTIFAFILAKRIYFYIVIKEIHMESVTIVSQERTFTGKKGAKATRREGLVPGIVYGGKETIHFAATPKQFKDLVFTPDFKLAEIQVGEKKIKCIVQDMQFHPVSDELIHIDFLELVEKKAFKVELPLRFKGTAPGVKTGGSLIQKVRRVKVKTTLDKLVDGLNVDISKLELGDSVRVKDIELEEGMELLTAPAIPVLSVEIPRALRSATDVAAEEGEEAEEAAEGATADAAPAE